MRKHWLTSRYISSFMSFALSAGRAPNQTYSFLSLWTSQERIGRVSVTGVIEVVTPYSIACFSYPVQSPAFLQG